MFCRCPRILIPLLDRTTKRPHQLIEKLSKHFSFFDFFVTHSVWNKILIHPLAWKTNGPIWISPRGRRYTDIDQKWVEWKTRQLYQVEEKKSENIWQLTQQLRTNRREKLEDKGVTCSPLWDTKISKVDGFDDPEDCIYKFGSRTRERIHGKRTPILSLSLISIAEMHWKTYGSNFWKCYLSCKPLQKGDSHSEGQKFVNGIYVTI